MYTRNDSLKENSPTSLCIWWQTLIKESQPISDAFFHFFNNLGWSRILGLKPPFWICHYLPGVLGEFSRQAWQVTSHPKSPRTTGNEAVLYVYNVCWRRFIFQVIKTKKSASVLNFHNFTILRSVFYSRNVCVSNRNRYISYIHSELMLLFLLVFTMRISLLSFENEDILLSW